MVALRRLGLSLVACFAVLASAPFVGCGGTGTTVTTDGAVATCVTAADCVHGDAGSATVACCAGVCIDTAGDPANCGACAKVCPAPPSASASCTAGVCGLGACTAGHANCDNLPANGCEVDTSSDVQDCGGCGRACGTAVHGTMQCVSGTCTPSCELGWAHCSPNPSDGCNVNVATDLSNCGACGSACGPFPNATAACTSGTCSLSSCNAGFVDCDKDARNGCEVARLTDPKNCGACGNACAVVANGTVGCVNGTCGGVACNPGWGDCDRNPANGCETPTVADAQNCGGCGLACVGPNSTQACVGGACTITACSAGTAHCSTRASDGCEVQTASDPRNCGGCGKACPTPLNTTATCKAGVCGIGACAFGFADCNSNAADGCEANLVTLANCGACGISCGATPHATAACNNGNCGIGQCDPGYGDCNHVATDGCETALTNNPNHCGQCGNACNLPQAVSQCSGTQCTISRCNSGFADCDGVVANGCETSTATDPNNCGACRMACGAGRTCQAGVCTNRFVFATSQVIAGQSVTCNSVDNTATYTGCNSPSLVTGGMSYPLASAHHATGTVSASTGAFKYEAFCRSLGGSGIISIDDLSSGGFCSIFASTVWAWNAGWFQTTETCYYAAGVRCYY